MCRGGSRLGVGGLHLMDLVIGNVLADRGVALFLLEHAIFEVAVFEQFKRIAGQQPGPTGRDLPGLHVGYRIGLVDGHRLAP